jgi:hypothetical protein
MDMYVSLHVREFRFQKELSSSVDYQMKRFFAQCHHSVLGVEEDVESHHQVTQRESKVRRTQLAIAGSEGRRRVRSLGMQVPYRHGEDGRMAPPRKPVFY